MGGNPEPLITVVVPVKNGVEVIGRQLEALASQDFGGAWELIISDNGSNDGLVEEVERWRSRFPAVTIVDSSSAPGAGPARNAGARVARGRYLAFCDADDRVADGWLSALATSLADHPFVTGAIDHDTLNPASTGSWHFRSHIDSVPLGARFLPYALSGNMGVWKSAFEEVGGFPEDLVLGEDMALSWSLQLAGYPLQFERNAVVAYQHRDTMGSLWKQHVGYGAAEVSLYRRFRSLGQPRSRLPGALRAYLRLLARLPRLRHPERRSGWIREAARRYGRLRGSLRERVLYL